jgi:hypothetical protein
VHVVLEFVAKRLIVADRQVVKLALARLGERDRTPRNVVRLAKGNLRRGVSRTDKRAKCENTLTPLRTR